MYLRKLESPRKTNAVYIGPFSFTPKGDHWIADHATNERRGVLLRTQITIDGPNDRWEWTVRSISYTRHPLTLEGGGF